MTETQPAHFIDEPIEVFFNHPPLWEKAPPCPDSFSWRDETYHVETLLEEWADFTRRGRAARNMMPTHAATATVKGSWGVGRYHFRVRVSEGGRIFELYYDRAPSSITERKGTWHLLSERAAVDINPPTVP